MENQITIYNHRHLYDTYVNSKNYSAGEFGTLLNQTFMQSANTINSAKEAVLIYLAYFKYATCESLQIFNGIERNSSYLKFKCMSQLKKDGYIDKMVLGNTIGKNTALFFLTAKGIEFLKEKGYVEAANNATSFLSTEKKSRMESIRLHEYCLSLFLSSFIHSDSCTFVEYENSLLISSNYRDLKRALRPDAVLRVLTPINYLPDNIKKRDLPSETLRRQSTFENNEDIRDYFMRTYYIEQDMGTEQLNILENKIFAYYTHNLYNIDLLNNYTGIIFSFAKSYTVTDEYLKDASTIKRLCDFIKYSNETLSQDNTAPYTLNSFLHMSSKDAKKAKAYIGEKYYDDVRKVACQLKSALMQLHKHNCVTNYDAQYIYPNHPIPCNKQRMNYRDNFIYRFNYSRSAANLESNSSTIKRSQHSSAENFNRLFSFSNNVFTEDVHVDKSATDYNSGIPTEEALESLDLTYEELVLYHKGMVNGYCSEVYNSLYLFALNKAQYTFAQKRKLNLCHLLTDSMEYFSLGDGANNKLRVVRQMLGGLSVYGTSTVLSANSLYYIMPERSHYLEQLKKSLSTYIEIDRGICHRSYLLRPVPFNGYPETFNMETDEFFICLEELKDLIAVAPAYTFTFSFLPSETSDLSDIVSSPTSAAEILAAYYSENADKPAEPISNDINDRIPLSSFDFVPVDEDYEDWEDDISEEMTIDNCKYLPPARNRNPIPADSTAIYPAGKNMYHVCIENISVDISGYIRMYYMCSYVTRHTDMLLIATVDTYTEAAEFASHFPDLYKDDNLSSFSFCGLQLVFMLNSDLGCKQNVLFRVASDGGIYRIHGTSLKKD